LKDCSDNFTADLSEYEYKFVTADYRVQ